MTTRQRQGPDPEGEWKLMFSQQHAKLLQSLQEAAEEHLRQQELLVNGLLEAKQGGATRQELLVNGLLEAKQDGATRQESTTVPELSIAERQELPPTAPKEPSTMSERPMTPSVLTTMPEVEIPREEVLAVCDFGSTLQPVGEQKRSHSSTRSRLTRSKTGLQSYLDDEMGDLTAGVMFMSPNRASLHPLGNESLVHRLAALLRFPQEPERTGCLARIVISTQFEVLTFLVISTYSAFAIWMTNRLVNQPEVLESTPVVWAETCFLIFFISELLVKLVVHRLYFFCNGDMGWNLLDLIIIVISVVDFALNAFSASGGSALQDVNYVRVLRALRISKSLRILRAVRFVSELRVLMMCIVTSFSVLFWSVMLLLLIQAGVSTALVQLVAGHVHEERSHGVEEEALEDLISGFGTVQASMIQLFMSTTGGIDWGSVLRLMNQTGPAATLVYGLYLLFFFVAAWNIITSLFMEKAMKLAQPDLETQMINKHKEDVQQSIEIVKLLEDTDQSGQGTISLPQFQRYMQMARFRHFFEFRDLEIKDAEMFFRMLSAISDSDDVPYDTFAQGCLRMKGYASVLDLQSLRIELKTMYIGQRQLFGQLSEELAAVVEYVERQKDSSEEGFIQDVQSGTVGAKSDPVGQPSSLPL